MEVSNGYFRLAKKRKITSTEPYSVFASGHLGDLEIVIHHGMWSQTALCKQKIKKLNTIFFKGLNRESSPEKQHLSFSQTQSRVCFPKRG